MNKTTKRNPWAWIPTLYFAQGLPYVAVNVLTVILYKRLGISNTDIALYTGWLYLPWVIKPFWSPFVDIIKTKRWWTVLMQWIIGFGLAAVAFSIPTPFFFQLTLAIFWLVGFASATHDIASDGFYMIALEEHQQAAYVGIRSTFYRVATIIGQGVLVIIAGVIESNTGLDPANITVQANPTIQTTEYCIPAPIHPTAEQQAKEQFIFSTSQLTMGTKAPDSITTTIDGVTATIPFARFSSAMLDSIGKLNISNGFVAQEKPAEAGESVVAPKENSALEMWIKGTFGEERQEIKAANNNFAIIGVTLTKAPEPGEDRILIVTYRSGDQSIKLEQNKISTRFVFNKDNWNKTAYLYFEADNKLATTTTADFQGTSGNIPLAWTIVFIVLSVFFLLAALYHGYILPKPAADKHIGSEKATAKDIIKGFSNTFVTFFKKKQIWIAMAFMLLYRLPEAQLIKIINPFFLDPIDKGGLGLTTGQVGLVYGTIGIIALTIGGIIGGICASRGGLRKWLWPMALSISLNSIVYILLSAFQPDPSTIGGMVAICAGMFVDQFGYGFGFTAFMLYMMYFADGPYKTSHYAICTAFMALGMMLPGMWSGWLQELIGYNHFFVWTLICCVATWLVTSLIKVDPSYGRKQTVAEQIDEENITEDQEL